MAIAVAMSGCDACSLFWGIGFLSGLTDQDDGVIILATLLLFPSTIALYGVLQMWFAAKEAVERRATERGRRKERERISKALKRHGVELPPEIARILAGESDDDQSEQ